jgi:hypothetical protein
VYSASEAYASEALFKITGKYVGDYNTPKYPEYAAVFKFALEYELTKPRAQKGPPQNNCGGPFACAADAPIEGPAPSGFVQWRPPKTLAAPIVGLFFAGRRWHNPLIPTGISETRRLV